MRPRLCGDLVAPSGTRSPWSSVEVAVGTAAHRLAHPSPRREDTCGSAGSSAGSLCALAPTEPNARATVHCRVEISVHVTVALLGGVMEQSPGELDDQVELGKVDVTGETAARSLRGPLPAPD